MAAAQTSSAAMLCVLLWCASTAAALQSVPDKTASTGWPLLQQREQGHFVKHANPVKSASTAKGGTYYPFGLKPVADGEVSAMSVGNGIDYHAGPVIIGDVFVYLIWYGKWANPADKQILTNLVANIGGTPYWAINKGYYSTAPAGTKSYVTTAVLLAGEASDPAYSRGKVLSDDDIQAIVEAQIASGALPVTATTGVYMVLTDSDVELTSGFCDSYCGWHASASMFGSTIRFGFVGNGLSCPNQCANSNGITPNGNWAIDAMASILAHEMEEAITDPEFSAWYDSAGMENADKCAWRYGNTYTTANGGKANMRLGNVDYLIQQNWVNDKGGYCASSWTGAAG